ncbi:MAG: CHAP domain-containing protein [Candidatus Dormibacteria bacterium]
MPRPNLRLIHAAVAVLAGGLLLAGVLSGAPAGIQAAARTAGYWPSPASFQAGQYFDKPAAVPGSIPALLASLVSAPSGATLAALAAEYRTSPEELAWANQVPAGQALQAGQPLLIPPPGPTVLVRVLPGETLASFSNRFRVSTRVVLDYNNLTTAGALVPNSFLLMPLAASPSSLPSADLMPLQPGFPEVTPSTPAVPNQFPWGQCTYWVASQRSVPWSGNAIQWWAEARSMGVPEGQVPVVGAIAVFNIGYYGHVAYVTKVLPDGSWQQSEMNVYGLGVLDTRTMVPGEGAFVGFIY